jgi:hypothetical protein
VHALTHLVHLTLLSHASKNMIGSTSEHPYKKINTLQ